MTKRIKYPSRAVYFAVQSHLLDEDAHAAKVEEDRINRLNSYMFVVESLEEFKRKFGL